MNYKITSKYGALIGKKMCWILFIWDKIWQKCEKNNYINKWSNSQFKANFILLKKHTVYGLHMTYQQSGIFDFI
mgnify:CR=1 FL=1